jgi:ADP-heptose:LPS heptosyltransferase
LTRILIFRLGSLGDTLIALPALRLVAAAFPNAERRMLTTFPPHAKAPASSAILEHTGLIHGYFRYSYGTRSPRELLKLWWQLVRWRPQVLVYLNGTRPLAIARRDALFCRLAGVTRVIGVPETEEQMNCQPYTFPDGVTALEHEARRLCRNLTAIAPADLDAYLADPASWSLALTAAEQTRATEALTPLAGHKVLAVSIGTKVQSKDWGQDNWRSLLTRVGQLYPHHALALLGAPEESAASEFAAAGFRSTSSSPVVNLCGALTPRESAAVLARSAVFLGHDSGPMHLAAAVGTPCVALFAARNIPRVWYPHGPHHRILYHQVDCAGCGLETCIIEKKKCLLSITPDEVLIALAAVLPSNQ